MDLSEDFPLIVVKDSFLVNLILKGKNCVVEIVCNHGNRVILMLVIVDEERDNL